MQSRHSASRVQAQSTKREMWIGQRPIRSAHTQEMPQLRIFDAARQAAAAEHAASSPVNPVDAKNRQDEHLTPNGSCCAT